MRRLMQGLAIAMAVAGVLALGACNQATSGPPRNPVSSSSVASTSTSTATFPTGATVTLGPSTFGQASVTIDAGQALRLVDPAATGGIHRLCLGTAGHCDSSAQGPQNLLGPGLLITSGETQDIAFPQAGQYQVTRTIHPRMHLSISVLATG